MEQESSATQETAADVVLGSDQFRFLDEDELSTCVEMSETTACE